MRTGFQKNNIVIGIEDLPGSKRPSLTVYPDAKDENARVKVATFVSKEDAEWFYEMMQAMLGISL